MVELLSMLLGVLGVGDLGLSGGARLPQADDPDLIGGERPPR